MILPTSEEIDLISKIRLERAYETFSEAEGVAKLGYWRVVVNRLFYACHYAVLGLLLKNGYTSRTLEGALAIFVTKFAANGTIDKEQDNLYRKLNSIRKNEDYDDLFCLEKEDVEALFVPTKQFIKTIENLIKNNPQ